MKKAKCAKCGKVMEGYTENHVEYMLKQHLLSNKCRKRGIFGG